MKNQSFRVRKRNISRGVLALSVLFLGFSSCGMRTFFNNWGNDGIKKMGHSVQVGAFRRLNLAVDLEKKLRYWGVDAFHFKHADGLFKVRFGDYPSYEEAKRAAVRVRQEGLIGGFFIIRPSSYAVARGSNPGPGRTPDRPDKPHKPDTDSVNSIREEILKTAQRFLGIPYRWGGTSADKGFDCSGLTLTVYKLNGFRIPRNAASQMRAGKPVSKNSLRVGDLVFFDTAGGGSISHVGIYAGGGKFIHAPRSGKAVEYAPLSNSYYRRTYRGARTYF